jgi:M6 family metalloprotease-like protein
MRHLKKLIFLGAMLFPIAAFAVSPNPELLKKWHKEGSYAQKVAQYTQKVKTSPYDKVKKSFPSTGSRKVLVILAAFSDAAFDSTSSTSYYKELFETGTASNSLTWRKYYQDMSNNNLNLTFDIYGPYTASNTHDYYGANDTNGNDVYPDTLVKEAVQALIADKDATVDFSDYDNDNDGVVDSIIVIHQGSGEESSGTAGDIWSHAYNITSAGLTADGVSFSSYAAQPEFGSTAGDSTIGVFTHEFGHVLGLPDLYDTTYTTSGVGQWSLMAGGSWNGPAGEAGKVPAPLLAWERAQLGWLTPTATDAGALPFSRTPGIILFLILFAGFASLSFKLKRRWIAQTAAVLTLLPCMVLFAPGCGSSSDKDEKTSATYTIEDIAASNSAYKVSLKSSTISSANYDQYLLIENIVKTTGTWTEYLPGDGLLITKIDEYIIAVLRQYNSINGYDNNGTYLPIHGVSIMQAGGTATLWNSNGSALDTDTYPSYTTDSIGPDTATHTGSYPYAGPNTNYTVWSATGGYNTGYNGNSGVDIHDISAKGASMTFIVTR